MQDKITPSPFQSAVTDWVKNGSGSAIVRARAGSGKTKLLELCLPEIPESASVQMFAFNKPIGEELKRRIEDLKAELGRPFRGFRAGTFHSVALGAVARHLQCPVSAINIDGGKMRKLLKLRVGEEAYALYGDFVTKLVGYAKGEGVGCLTPDTIDAWLAIVQHHDLYLESEEGNEAEAIELARKLLRWSIEAAKPAEGMPWIDFDDMLYLVVSWRLRLWQNDWVFIDEAQDTNPVRRAIAKLALRPGGRLVAVGDDRQAIYGFTGATAEALDLIKREFNCTEFTLPVCYRCSKAAIARAQQIVSDIRAWDGAPDGSDVVLPLPEALAKLTDRDAILCRNTAPLVKLAYQIIAKNRACAVLGREIGQGLVGLVKQMRAKNLESLQTKLSNWRDREVANFTAKGEEGKAEAINDRYECIVTIVASLHENERTLPKLVAKIESLFSDDGGKLLLSTIHKAKGREWPTVAILKPELSPSKWARQDWQAVQEDNLIYVRDTRAQLNVITITEPAKPQG